MKYIYIFFPSEGVEVVCDYNYYQKMLASDFYANQKRLEVIGCIKRLPNDVIYFVLSL
jgi:hypothetical protein